MFTSVFLFLPLAAYSFVLVTQGSLSTRTDWISGVALGIVLNAGLIRLINGL